MLDDGIELFRLDFQILFENFGVNLFSFLINGIDTLIDIPRTLVRLDLKIVRIARFATTLFITDFYKNYFCEFIKRRCWGALAASP